MGLSSFATMTLLTKNSFLEELRKQYVLTARAKGCSERQVLYGHIFRNAMLLVIAGFPSAFVGAFFAGVGRQGKDEGHGRIREVADRREVAIPGTAQIVKAAFLDSKKPQWGRRTTGRELLADWVTAPDNPYFARAAANRVWARFFGTGIASRASIKAYSANAPGQRPITRSPVPTTSPATSWPAGFAVPALMRPPTINSPRLSPAAFTFTRSWPAAGCGWGTSRLSSLVLSPSATR